MYAIYKKELRSSIFGMTGPIFIAAVLVAVGIFVFFYQLANQMVQIEYSFISASVWAFIFTPLLTMRSFSEERRAKTDQLLYSLPISTTQIVLGKFFAMATILAVPCAVMCVYPLIFSSYASDGMSFGVNYSAILGFFLLGCAIIAIGMLISSFFESQVISAILNLMVILVLYFMANLQTYIPSDAWFTLALFIVLSLIVAAVVYYSTKNIVAAAITGVLLVGASVAVYLINSELYIGLAGTVISYLFIFEPIMNIGYGIFDITCFVYYLSVAALFVFVTIQSFERRRWN